MNVPPVMGGPWPLGVSYGIQRNPLAVPQRQVAVFRLWTDRHPIVVPDGYPHAAPQLAVPLPATVTDAVAAADGVFSTIAPGRYAEGIVWHSASGRDPIKAINNQFLLKHGDT